MIRIKHSTGNDYYRSEELCTSATIWNPAMGTKGGIRFYDGDLKLVCDFRLGDQPDETLMVAYPYNDKKTMTEIAERLEPEIRDAIIEATKLEPERRIFTIDLNGEQVKVLKKEDFNRFSSVSNPQDELFTFDNPDPKVGFPRVYIHEKMQKTSTVYGKSFGVLAKTSRIAFPPIKGEPTEDGARFTYMLMNSYANLKFVPEVPNLRGMHWPTKLNCEMPRVLNTADFEKFLIEIGIDKVIFDSNGKLKSTQGSEIVEAEEVDDADWGEEDMPVVPYVASSASDTLVELVKETIDDKGYFNLADAFSVGFDKILGMIPISDSIIPAHIDFPGLVRRMCVYRGIFHVIPLGDTGDNLAEILDLDDISMKICTEENYPRNTNPFVPAEEY